MAGFKLLSTGESNRKLALSGGKGFMLYGLSLRPHKGSGFNVCAWAGFCSKLCVLEESGRGCMTNVRDARDRKTRLFFQDRAQFLAWLRADLAIAQRTADRKGLKLAVRLNVASDLLWEKVARGLIESYPLAIFYDYSKCPRVRKTPENYHITHSYSEKMTDRQARHLIKNGRNVAVVFDTDYRPSVGIKGPLPDSFLNTPVIDGDLHDIRIPQFDGSGVVVGLRGKGGLQNVLSGVAGGFIVATAGGVWARTAALAATKLKGSTKARRMIRAALESAWDEGIDTSKTVGIARVTTLTLSAAA